MGCATSLEASRKRRWAEKMEEEEEEEDQEDLEVPNTKNAKCTETIVLETQEVATKVHYSNQDPEKSIGIM